MNSPIYIPIFRLRQQEKNVLNSFDFGKHIYPYVEIFRKQPIKSREPKVGSKTKPKEPKNFHEHYLPVLNRIKSEKIFVDLPVHLKRRKGMKKDVIEFLSTVVERREIRTHHVLSLSSCDKVIPVISTYSQIGTGEINTIQLQEADLRGAFDILAFRSSALILASDIIQIQKIVKPQDFFFIDLQELCLSNSDDVETVSSITDRLLTFDKCNVVVINSPIPHTTTNVGLDHGHRIRTIDNSLMDKIGQFRANSFADYGGVKKDLVEEGGGRSPGLIFYDAIENSFYGYRGRKRNKSEEVDLDDLREIIVRDLLTSDIVSKMKESHLEYLGDRNFGWKMVNDMWDKTEPWKSQAKFKRIAMEHYIHCIRTKIDAGYFNT